MTAIVSVLVIIFFSLLLTRIATIALAATGLSRESARFQARSAFTGAGFTTSESEQVVRHPVRRRIVMLLMLLGNAGIVAVIASFVIAFVDQDAATAWWMRFALLFGGIVALWFLANSRLIDRYVTRVTMWAIGRWTAIDTRDYAGLLHIGGDYLITELAVPEDHWLANRDLNELGLRQEGVILLGIHRSDGTYLGVPKGETVIRPGDTVILYSRAGRVKELDQRRRGGQGGVAHDEAVRRQRQDLAEQGPTERAGAEPRDRA